MLQNFISQIFVDLIIPLKKTCKQQLKTTNQNMKLKTQTKADPTLKATKQE